MSSLDTDNTGRNHVSRVGVENIGKHFNGSTKVVPVLFVIVGSHMPADTEDFFIRQVNKGLGKDNGLVTVAVQDQVLFSLPFTGNPVILVLVGLAQVVKHTYQVGASRPLPMQVQLFSQFQ